MALAVARIGRTTTRVRWTGTSSGGSGGTVDLTQATLLATDTVAGPLREALRAAASNADWDALTNDMSLKLSVHSIPGTAFAQPSFNFTLAGPNNVLRFTMDTDAEVSIFELEAVHTIVQ